MLLLPDPLYRADQLGGAAFLWFGQITATIPPQVVTPESFQVLGRVHTQAPLWSDSLEMLLGGWHVLREGSTRTLDDLADLKDRTEVLWLVYSATSDAMARAGTLIQTVGLRHEDLLDAIDVPAACGELVRHLFLERWLETDKDLEAFWDACAETLDSRELKNRLVEAYLLRLSAFGELPSAFALTNPRLLDLIWRCWVVAGSPEASTAEQALDADVVGYEIFRHLVSPHVDPLDADGAFRTGVLLATKREEIEALRRQCLRLAQKVPSMPLHRLDAEVAAFVELHVQDDLRALIEMGARTSQEYMASISSDRAAWASMLAAISGAANGSTGFTVAGGIGVVATALSKGVAVKWQAHTEIRDSPYRLIRSMTK